MGRIEQELVRKSERCMTSPGETKTPTRTGIGVEIVGSGMALPSRRVTNDDLAKFVDTSDEWIVQRTGIRSRYLLGDDQTIEGIAGDAVKSALTAAGLEPGDLDLLICASTRPDFLCPALACRVVEQVGAIPCGAFDLNVACSGFLAALGVGESMIRSGSYKTIAVVGAEALSRVVNWEDRRTCVLFGDGAACAILRASDDSSKGILYQRLHSDAERGRALYLPEEQGQIPPGEEERYNGKLGTLQMNGASVYKFAVQILADSVENALDAVGMTSDDISMVIPHQSNIRMLQSSWKRLGFNEDKILINIDKYGNTGAASCGICLHECIATGRVKPGDKVVFVAQGGGLSWGASVWQL